MTAVVEILKEDLGVGDLNAIREIIAEIEQRIQRFQSGREG